MKVYKILRDSKDKFIGLEEVESSKLDKQRKLDNESGEITRTFNISIKDSKFENCYFFNCGPKAMVEAVLPIELKLSSPEIICSSVDYMTRCGIGICGSCADKSGKRTCVEGPFMKPNL